MGATLPLIVRRFVGQKSPLGRLSGLFYAVTTAGALAGVLGVSFVLLPRLGARTTTCIAVGVNIAVGAASLLIGLGQGSMEAPTDATAWGASGSVVSADQARGALVCVAISGLAALALEVVWTRVLIQSLSATVYS